MDYYQLLLILSTVQIKIPGMNPMNSIEFRIVGDTSIMRDPQVIL